MTAITVDRFRGCPVPKMHLAQELVDYIIDFLHDDPETLLQVSLVSRTWVIRARIHLCKSPKITHSKLSSADSSHLIALCGYVKTLHFTWPADATNLSSIFDCFEQSEPHTLAIYSCELHRLDEQIIRRYFAKYPCTSTTTLELHNISLTRTTFLILLSLFPNVDDLTISVDKWKSRPGITFGEIIEQISLPHPRVRGSFKFTDPLPHITWSYSIGALLRTVATLPLQFQTVSLDYNGLSRSHVSIILEACSKTVRKVFIGQPHRKFQPRFPATIPRT